MPGVRRPQRDELAQVGEVLAAAFAEDPVFRWLVPSSRRWERHAPAWFATEAGFQHRGHGEVLVDETMGGAAMWSPPGRWKHSRSAELGIVPQSLRLMHTGALAGLAAIGRVEALHPAHPEHWYLAALGTDPAHQGKGIGSALVAHITRRCDVEGVPAYLESSNESNIPFYERHGFALHDAIELPRGGPLVWSMWRDPRPA